MVKLVLRNTRRGLPAVGRRAGTLGEIVNSGSSSFYFTERSAVYFYPISIVFLLRQPAAAGTFYNPNDSFPYTGGSYLLQKT